MGLTFEEIGCLMLIMVIHAAPLGILMTVSAVHHTRRWLKNAARSPERTGEAVAPIVASQKLGVPALERLGFMHTSDSVGITS